MWQRLTPFWYEAHALRLLHLEAIEVGAPNSLFHGLPLKYWFDFINFYKMYKLKLIKTKKKNIKILRTNTIKINSYIFFGIPSSLTLPFYFPFYCLYHQEIRQYWVPTYQEIFFPIWLFIFLFLLPFLLTL